MSENDEYKGIAVASPSEPTQLGSPADFPENFKAPEEIAVAREFKELVEPIDPETSALLNSEDEELTEVEADEFLASLMGEAAQHQFIPETPEEIEARAQATEAARNYDVYGNVAVVETKLVDLKKSVEEFLIALNTHLNAEFNRAVMHDDAETQNSLLESEAPRWYQLGVQDMQVAFMKLERSLHHPKGL